MEMVQTYLKLAQHDLDASHHLVSPVDNWGFYPCAFALPMYRPVHPARPIPGLPKLASQSKIEVLVANPI